ncbi:hypothetical protein H072_6490 [Dactylellina haptotyla CBS 200.50]|uniref:Uncharacterized protein n=1 Tax=Dactylellina haptotyla (strain CBS 200.50) TaxID=1284197 RepID=S8BK53_DACHA|nr:hypothetical protein H072_6490 [Dactylellina haptotyla CBS 200.50]
MPKAKARPLPAPEHSLEGNEALPAWGVTEDEIEGAIRGIFDSTQPLQQRVENFCEVLRDSFNMDPEDARNSREEILEVTTQIKAHVAMKAVEADWSSHEVVQLVSMIDDLEASLSEEDVYGPWPNIMSTNRYKMPLAAQYAISNCALVGIQVSIPGFTSTATSASATGASRTPSTTSAGAATTTGTGGSASSSSLGSETPASNSEGSSGNPTSAPSGGGSSTNVGAIVGGVVGGIVVLAALGILGFWLLKRERRKKLEMETAMGGVPPKPPMAADPNSQSIWTGDNTYSWNPQTNTHDVQGGTPVGG